MSDTNVTERPQWDKAQRLSLIVGLIALGLAALGGILGALIQPQPGSFIAFFASKKQFFRSYLFGIQCWLAVGLGSLVILMIHHLAGGNWGRVIRRNLEAATRAIPWLALLFLPVFLGLKDIYTWSHWNEEQIGNSHILQIKSRYLNIPFFIARSVVYFAVFVALAYFLNRLSKAQEENNTPERRMALLKLSAFGLPLYGVCITFASVDWVMSLEPLWFSTMYGVMFAVAQILAAHSFSVLVLARIAPEPPLRDFVTRGHLRDLGSLLLAFVMLWAYTSFSQFLIIWSGNVPEETPWYLKRLGGGWQVIAVALVLLHFVLPFFLLLSRQVKGNARSLSLVASIMLIMCFVDMFWWIVPAYHDHHGTQIQHFSLHWMDLATLIGIGGIWSWAFLKALKQRTLLPIEPPEENHHGE